MVIPLGLSAIDQQAFTDKLLTHHSIHTEVAVLDLAGNRIGSPLSDRVLSGQVNIDRTAAVTRSCTLSLLDPGRTMAFDSDSPDDGAVFLDRMIRVTYSVLVGTTWVNVPVFTGPVSAMSRDNDVVNLEAQGKEVLSMGAAWTTRTYKTGANRVNAVRDILHDLAGEDRFQFPSDPAKLPVDVNVGLESVPWTVARRIASGLHLQLFYDGRGVCRMRPLPGSPNFVFQEGDGGGITTTPQVSFSAENVKNTVRVKGFGTVEARISAPASHPLSPGRLGRNGVARRLLEVVENDTIRSKAEAMKVAQGRLNELLLTQVSVSFDTLPIPHLEPADIIRVETSDYSAQFRLNQTSLPLTTGETMTMGYIRNVSAHRKQIRR